MLPFLLSLLACNPDPYPGEEGKILHVGLRLLPKSFDPPQVDDEGSGAIASQVYEGLLAYHPFARPYQLIPALAEDMPVISDDKLTYTYHLRKGVLFGLGIAVIGSLVMFFFTSQDDAIRAEYPLATERIRNAIRSFAQDQ